MTYPQPTDKLGDLAVAIKALADWADARLPGTAIEVFSGLKNTNGTGDITHTFATITEVQCIVQAAYDANPSQPSWVTLQIPQYAILSGSAPDTIYARAYRIDGTPLTSREVMVCIYGWGVPK